MDKLKQIQSMHLKQLLNDLSEQGISQKDFAEMVGVSQVTVSNWKRGKQGINPSNAELINSFFREYSVEYLLGYSEYQNEQSEKTARAFQDLSVKECVEYLAKNQGFQVSAQGLFNPDEYRELVKDGYRSIAELKSVQHVERIENSDGEVLKLTAEQWNAFVDEVGGYIEMRLNSMLERGCW